MIYLQLFYEFAKIGLFSVGGGLATLPFLQALSDKTGWYTLEQLADMIAISESTPGPIGINMATYVGFTSGGVLGGIIATLAIILPAIIVVLLVARVLQTFSKHWAVEAAFYGLRAASLGLIIAAAYSVLKITFINTALYETTGSLLDLFQWKSIILAVVLFFAMKKWKLHPVAAIGFSAVVGAVLGFAGV